MRIETPLLTALVALTLGGVAACSMSTSGQTASSSDRNTVSREELAATNSATVYEALERVRPQWLNTRGPVSMTDSQEARPNVYMNGTRVGELEYLREVYVVDVRELRFWPAGEASARFGMGNPRGVIEIIPRR